MPASSPAASSPAASSPAGPLPAAPLPATPLPDAGASLGRVLGRVARNTLAAAFSDRISIASAGCAFFTTLALFPAMSVLIALYGLLFNPVTVEPQLAVLHDVLPPEVFGLIARWMHHLVVQSHRNLGLGIGISSVITLWSAAVGTRALLGTLNAAYGQGKRSRPLLLHAAAIGLTLAGIVAAIGAIGLLDMLPFAITLLGLTEYSRSLLHLLANGLLIAAASLSVALLYRIGPAGPTPPGRHVIPGMVLAIVLWLIDSAILNFYVDRVARFGLTYGPLVAVIGLMLWFFLTFQAVLIGAEFNAQLGHATDPGSPAD